VAEIDRVQARPINWNARSPAIKKEAPDMNAVEMKDSVQLSSKRGAFRSTTGISLDRAGKALDDQEIETSEKLWDYGTGSYITEGARLGPDGNIYFSDRGGRLYSFRGGTRLWACDLEAKKDVPGDGVSAPEIASDGTAYVTVGSKLCAVKDGKNIWDFDCPERHRGFKKPCIGPDGTIYVTDYANNLFAVRDGKKLWGMANREGDFTRPAVGPDGMVYVANRHDGTLYAIKDGETQWEYKTGKRQRHSFNDLISLESHPVLGNDGTVYILSGSTIHAVRRGKRVWKYKVDGFSEKSPLPGPDGNVYINAGGTITAVRDGKKVRDYGPFEKGVRGFTISQDGTMYVDSGTTLQVSRDGARQWDFTAGELYAPPCVDENGTVYIGDFGGNFFAVRDGRPRLSQPGTSSDSPGEDPPSVETDDGWLIIGDVKLPVNDSPYQENGSGI
jgi:hypothetical protein